MTDFRAALQKLLNEVHDLRLEAGNPSLRSAVTEARAALAKQPKTEQPPKNCWLDDEPDLCPTPCVFDDSSDAIYNCCFAIKLNAEGKPKETCKYYRAAQSEPVGPTDEELLQIFDTVCLSEGGTVDEIHLRGLRAVLARWGQS